MQTFADVHRWADVKMVNYIVHPQENHAAVPRPDVLETLPADRAFLLFANNARARIAFAEIVLRYLQENEAISLGPCCFVTLTPAACACPVGDRHPYENLPSKAFRRRIGSAANFDVRVLQQTARQALGTVPFIGMVEAALHYRWGPQGGSFGDWISWHCHLLTWGMAQEALSRHLAPFRARHRSMRQDLSAAHVQAVRAGDTERQFLYALKAPQKLYRMEHFKRPWTNPGTGEVRHPGWHMQKDWLQTGHRIRLLDIMGDRTLDQLLFGNGAGTALVRAIREEALAPFRRWEARQPYKLAA